MADVNAIINIDINSSSALLNLKRLESQIDQFNRSVSTSNATAAASQQGLNRALLDGINNTGLFTSKIVPVESSMKRFSTSLDEGRLSLGEYTRYAGSQLPGLSRVFRKEFDSIEQVATSRVKSMQTQYLALGKTVDGVTRTIASTPTGLARGMATDLAMTQQRQQIFNKLLDDGSTKLLNWGKNTQWAGRQLMVGFSLPLAAFGAAAAKTFMEIDKATISLKRVYGDLSTTKAELDSNVESVKGLGREYTKYGITLAETISLSARAAATGATNEGLMAATEQTLRFATLGQMDYNQALDTTISLQTAFAISNEDLGKTVDYLNAVENQTILTMEDMSLAIPRVATVVKGLGGSVEDLAVMMTAMREGGVSAENAANGLKSGLASLINPTKRASEGLAAMGVNLNQIITQNKGDLMGIITEFGTAINKLDEFSRQQVLEQVFGKFQYARMSALFTNITKDAGQAARAMDIAGMSAADLAKISEKELGQISESTSVKFQASMEKLKMSIAPIGEAFLKGITPIIDMVSKIADAFNNLPDGVKNAIAVLTGVVAGIGPVLLMTIGLLGNGIANITKFVQFIRKSLAGIKGDASAFNYLAQGELEATTASKALEGSTVTLTDKLLLQRGAVSGLTAEYERFARAAGIARAEMGSMGGAPVPSGGGRAPVPVPRVRKNTGGTIPGVGSTDTVPAMLTPGEFVINKKSTAQNLPLLHAINDGQKVGGFNKGGQIPGVQYFGVRPNIGGRVKPALPLSISDKRALAHASDSVELEGEIARSILGPAERLAYERRIAQTMRVEAKDRRVVGISSTYNNLFKSNTRGLTDKDQLKGFIAHIENSTLSELFPKGKSTSAKLKKNPISELPDSVQQKIKENLLTALGKSDIPFGDPEFAKAYESAISLTRKKLKGSELTEFDSAVAASKTLRETRLSFPKPDEELPEIKGKKAAIARVKRLGRVTSVKNGETFWYTEKSSGKATALMWNGQDYTTTTTGASRPSSQTSRELANEMPEPLFKNKGGQIPRLNRGGKFLGMPQKFNPKLEQELQTSTRLAQSGPGSQLPLSEFSTLEQGIGGYSAAFPGLNGIYVDAAGRRVVYKSHPSFESAEAEMLSGRLMSSLFGLESPSQVVVKRRHPVTGDTVFGVESAFDKKFAISETVEAGSGRQFTPSEAARQFIASGIRRDRDLQPANIRGNIVVDQGVAVTGVNDAGEPRAMAQGRTTTTDPRSVSKQLAVNAIMEKSGAKKFLAESLADIARSVGPDEFERLMVSAVSEARGRLHTSIDSLPTSESTKNVYRSILTKDFDELEGTHWRSYYDHLESLKVPVPKQPTEAALKKLELARQESTRSKASKDMAAHNIVSNRLGLPTAWARGVFRNTGGPIFESQTKIVPGVGSTDTVPAMLTPGEFVINKQATRENLPLLHAINNGKVINRNKGGQIPGMQYFATPRPQRVVQKPELPSVKDEPFIPDPALFGPNGTRYEGFEERTLLSGLRVLRNISGDGKTVMLQMGKYQPFHVGHEELLNQSIAVARTAGADFVFGASGSYGVQSNNPLSPRLKRRLIEEATGISPNMVGVTSSGKKLDDLLAELSNEGGYSRFMSSVGSDKVTERADSKKPTDPYRGAAGRIRDSDGRQVFEIIEGLTLSRDASTDVSNSSGTLLRELAMAGKIEEFAKLMPASVSRKTMEEVYHAIVGYKPFLKSRQPIPEEFNVRGYSLGGKVRLPFAKKKDPKELFRDPYLSEGSIERDKQEYVAGLTRFGEPIREDWRDVLLRLRKEAELSGDTQWRQRLLREYDLPFNIKEELQRETGTYKEDPRVVEQRRWFEKEQKRQRERGPRPPRRQELADRRWFEEQKAKQSKIRGYALGGGVGRFKNWSPQSSKISDNAKREQLLESLSQEQFGVSFSQLSSPMRRGLINDSYNFIGTSVPVSRQTDRGTGMFGVTRIGATESRGLTLEQMIQRDATKQAYQKYRRAVVSGEPNPRRHLPKNIQDKYDSMESEFMQTRNISGDMSDTEKKQFELEIERFLKSQVGFNKGGQIPQTQRFAFGGMVQSLKNKIEDLRTYLNLRHGAAPGVERIPLDPLSQSARDQQRNEDIYGPGIYHSDRYDAPQTYAGIPRPDGSYVYKGSSELGRMYSVSDVPGTIYRTSRNPRALLDFAKGKGFIHIDDIPDIFGSLEQQNLELRKMGYSGIIVPDAGARGESFIVDLVSGTQSYNALTKTNPNKPFRQSEMERMMAERQKNTQRKNTGGPIFESQSKIVPGIGSTDTVPAMLTPGEFVINKQSTRENLPLLHAINNGNVDGYAKGGQIGGVQYLTNGDEVDPVNAESRTEDGRLIRNLSGRQYAAPSDYAAESTRIARERPYGLQDVEEAIIRGTAGLTEQQIESYVRMNASHIVPEIGPEGGKLWRPENLQLDRGLINGYINDRQAEIGRILEDTDGQMFTNILNEVNSEHIGRGRGDLNLTSDNLKEELEKLSQGYHATTRESIRTLSAVATQRINPEPRDRALTAVAQNRLMGDYYETLGNRGYSPNLPVTQVFPRSQTIPSTEPTAPLPTSTVEKFKGVPADLSNKERKELRAQVQEEVKNSPVSQYTSADDNKRLENQIYERKLIEETQKKRLRLIDDEASFLKQRGVDHDKAMRIAEKTVDDGKAGIAKQKAEQRFDRKNAVVPIGTQSLPIVPPDDWSSRYRELAAEANDAEYEAQNLEEGNRRNARRNGIRQKMGVGIRGAGGAISMASMLPFMMQNEEGNFLGMNANLLGTGLMVGGMAMPAIGSAISAGGGAGMLAGGGMLAGAAAAAAVPLAIVAAAAAAVGVGLVLWRKNIDDNSKETANLTANLGVTANSVEAMGKILNVQSPSQRRQQMQLGFTANQNQIVQQVVPALQTEEGKKLIDELKVANSEDRYKKLGDYVEAAVATGMMTRKEATVFGKIAAETIGDTALGSRVAFAANMQEKGSSGMMGVARERMAALSTNDLARQGMASTGEGASISPAAAAAVVGSSLQIVSDLADVIQLAREEYQKGTISVREYRKIINEATSAQKLYNEYIIDAVNGSQERGGTRQAIKDQLIASGRATPEQLDMLSGGMNIGSSSPFGFDNAATTAGIANIMGEQGDPLNQRNWLQSVPAATLQFLSSKGLTTDKEMSMPDNFLGSLGSFIFGGVSDLDIESQDKVDKARTVAEEASNLYSQAESQGLEQKYLNAINSTDITVEQAMSFNEFLKSGTSEAITALKDLAAGNDILSTMFAASSRQAGMSESVIQVGLEFKKEGGDLTEYQNFINSLPKEKQIEYAINFSVLNANQRIKELKDIETMSARIGKENAAMFGGSEFYTTAIKNNETQPLLKQTRKAEKAGVGEAYGTIVAGIVTNDNGKPITVSEFLSLSESTIKTLDKWSKANKGAKKSIFLSLQTAFEGPDGKRISAQEASTIYDELVEEFGEGKITRLSDDVISKVIVLNVQIEGLENAEKALLASEVLQEAMAGDAPTGPQKAELQKLAAIRAALSNAKAVRASLVTDPDSAYKGGKGGGGGGGSNPLLDFKKSLLEQIRLYADIGMTLKKLFSSKMSILGILGKNKGIDDKLRAAGLGETMVQSIMGMGADAANKWAKANISGGKLNAAGKQQQTIARANVLGAVGSQAEGAIGSAATQQRASKLLTGGKYGKANAQTLSMIAGSPELADAYTAAVDEVIAADQKYKNASKGDKKDAKNEWDKKRESLEQYIERLNKASIDSTVAGKLEEARNARLAQTGKAAATASLGKNSKISKDVREAILGDPTSIVAYNELEQKMNNSIKAAAKKGKGSRGRNKQARLDTANFQDFLSGQEALLGNPEERRLQANLDTLNQAKTKSDRLYKEQTDPLLEQIELINKQIDAIQKLNNADQNRIRNLTREKEMLERQVETLNRKNEVDQKSIDKLQREDELRTRVADALNHELSIMSEKETKIREAYDKRIKALDEVAKINDYIINQQKSQLGLADALSRGDISAAVSVQQDMQAGNAQFATEQMRTGLQTGVDNQIEGLTTSGGLTRVQAEDQIRAIGQQTYQTSLLVRDLQDSIYSRNLDIAAIKIQQRDVDDRILVIQDDIYKRETAIIGLQTGKLTDLNDQLTAIQDQKDAVDKVAEANIMAAEVAIENYNLGIDQVDVVNKLALQWREVVKQIDKANQAMKNSLDELGPEPTDPGTEASKKAKEDYKVAFDNWKTKYDKIIGDNKTAKDNAYASGTAASAALSKPVAAAVAAAEVVDFPVDLSGIDWSQYATGGVIGQGGRDSVPSMLTPGEFVMRKASVQKYGAAMFERMNMGAFDMPRYNVQGPQEQSKASNTNNTSINAPVYNTYSVNVNVPNTNADPDVIANKVMMRMTQIDNSNIRSLRGNK